MYQNFPFPIQHIHEILTLLLVSCLGMLTFIKCLIEKQGMGCVSQYVFYRLGIPPLLLQFESTLSTGIWKKDVKDFACFYLRGKNQMFHEQVSSSPSFLAYSPSQKITLYVKRQNKTKPLFFTQFTLSFKILQNPQSPLAVWFPLSSFPHLPLKEKSSSLRD